MSPRLALAALVFGCGPMAFGQHSEEHEVEKIEAPDVPDTSGKRPDLAEVAKRIVDQTNGFRKKQGREPVAVDAKLTKTAQYFADYMARTDEYGHTADGSQPGDRAKKHGYDYCLIDENIACAFNSQGFATGRLADEFVTGWEHSPPHRRNMLDPDVTETGVAIARSGKTGYYYAVQMFGRPKSAAIEFKVVNQSGETVQYVIGDRTFDLPTRVIRTHTRCRPAALTFKWPGGKTTTAKPATGDRLIVAREPSGFVVKKE